MKNMLTLCSNYHKYDLFVFINHISLAIIFNVYFFMAYKFMKKYDKKKKEA